MVSPILVYVGLFTFGVCVGVIIFRAYIEHKYGVLLNFKKTSDQEAVLKKHLEIKP